MTLAEINSKINSLTKTDTISYPDEERVIDLNIWNQRTFTEILQSMDTSVEDDQNHSGYSILETPLVADQRDYNFGISEGVVKVKGVEIDYTGTKANRAYSLDTSEFPSGWMDESVSSIDEGRSQSSPGYGWKNNSLWLFPKPTDNTGKVYLEVSRTAKDFTEADLTTGTMTPGYDRNFHMILAYGVAREYFLSNRMYEDATGMMQEINKLFLSLKKQVGNKNEEYPLAFGNNLPNYN